MAGVILKPSEYKKLKDLKNQNLRDHMTDLELIFTMLGEASTTEIAVQNDAKGFHQNKKAAREGGEIAGNARKELDQMVEWLDFSQKKNYTALSR